MQPHLSLISRSLMSGHHERNAKRGVGAESTNIGSEKAPFSDALWSTDRRTDGVYLRSRLAGARALVRAKIRPSLVTAAVGGAVCG